MLRNAGQTIAARPERLVRNVDVAVLRPMMAEQILERIETTNASQRIASQHVVLAACLRALQVG